MRRYLSYIINLTIHKWIVFKLCLKCGMIWRGIAHDLDKYLPGSTCSHAKVYYNKDGSRNTLPPGAGSDLIDPKYRLLHFRFNKHHWQYWALATPAGNKFIEMDEKSIKEMIIDWQAVRIKRKIPGSLKDWFNSQALNMCFNPKTELRIKELIDGNVCTD